MEHINKVEIRGRVGTVRINEYNGRKVANFSVITDYLYKSREGVPASESTWHNVVAWYGKDIANLDNITKGALVHLSGRIRANKYTSADGVEKSYYEIMTNRLQVITEDA